MQFYWFIIKFGILTKGIVKVSKKLGV